MAIDHIISVDWSTVNVLPSPARHLQTERITSRLSEMLFSDPAMQYEDGGSNLPIHHNIYSPMQATTRTDSTKSQ